MSEIRPKTAETASRSLEERLTNLPRPAMPSDMEERVRARLRAELASAPFAPSPGPLPFLARKFGLTPAQQWAFLAVLTTLALGLFTRLIVMPVYFPEYCGIETGANKKPSSLDVYLKSHPSPNRPAYRP